MHWIFVLVVATSHYADAQCGGSAGTGGTISSVTSSSAIYNVHAFTTGGTFTIPQNTNVDVFLIGGGGGGGNDRAGGGGAGALIFYPQYQMAAGTYTVNVGNGGGGSTSSTVVGGSGGDSSIVLGATTVFKALGGGGGGGGGGAAASGIAGGSNGGPANTATRLSSVAGTNCVLGTCTYAAGAIQYVKGNIGGIAYPSCGGDTTMCNGGGAGGAGVIGGDASTIAAGVGGDGLCNIQIDQTVYNFATVYGSAYTSRAVAGAGNFYVAGGGSGGGWGTSAAPRYVTAGLGGGGTGCMMMGGGLTAPCTGLAGITNTGSGGGGGSTNYGSGGNGGAGLVLLRYATVCTSCPNNNTFVGGVCVASCANGVVAAGSGGATTTDVFNSYVHTFKSSGTLTLTSDVMADVLVIGGGGSGGSNLAGGGGAGAVVFQSQVTLPAGTYNVTVGAGADGFTTISPLVAPPGSASSLGTLFVAIGGGSGGCGGGVACGVGTTGTNGGSGGGGGGCWSGAAGYGGLGTGNIANGAAAVYGTNVFGNTGGLGKADTIMNGGGGGGAGAVGAAGTASVAGAGGVGITGASGTDFSQLFGAAFRSVAQSIGGIYYVAGGGGGGGTHAVPAAVGGMGGGGVGSCPNSAAATPATSGLTNTGSGGGGGGHYTLASGSGGSGLVMVRYTYCRQCAATTYWNGASCVACPSGQTSFNNVCGCPLWSVYSNSTCQSLTGSWTSASYPSGVVPSGDAGTPTASSWLPVGNGVTTSNTKGWAASQTWFFAYHTAFTPNILILLPTGVPGSVEYLSVKSGSTLQVPPIYSGAQYLYITFTRTAGNFGGVVKIGGDTNSDGTLDFFGEGAIGVSLEPPWVSTGTVYLADGTTTTFTYNVPVYGVATTRIILSLSSGTMAYQIKPTYDSSNVAISSQPWNTQFSGVNSLAAFGGAARGDPSKWDSIVFQSQTSSVQILSIEFKVVPTGYYRDSNLDVFPCGAGTYSTGMGVTSCTACPSNSVSTDGSSACTCLTAGLAFINGQCISACTVGQIINGTGCSNCSAGSYSTAGGATTCTRCAIGTYSGASGVSTCTNCTLGSYSIATGATACTGCDAGTYAYVPLNPVTTVSGGTLYTDVAGYDIFQFRGSGSITFTAPTVIDTFVGGGGGGGGAGWGGGGGAGAIIVYGNYILQPGTYTVTVGAAGGSQGNGGDSSIAGPDSTLLFKAIGGGAGASYRTDGQSGGSGGGAGNCALVGLSGGSASVSNVVATITGPSQYVFSTDGGLCIGGRSIPGSGGGAGQAGQSEASVGPKGGDGIYTSPLGVLSDVFGTAYTNVAPLQNGHYYIAGGGGAPGSDPCQGPGYGGAGAANCAGGGIPAANPSTCSGGGGGRTVFGGAGASGLIIIRAAKYTPENKTCSTCIAGTYSSAIGAINSATCTSCPTGQYSTTIGATAPCTVCPIGQYCLTVGSAPLNCTNKPINSYYTSTATNATGCQWMCSPGYYQSAGACVSCPIGSWCYAGVQNTCPTNSISVALASNQNQCLCKAGYFGNGSAAGTSPCPLCIAGSYCMGGNTNNSVTCPVNSTSSPGSSLLSQCYCPPGYQGENGSICSLCPAGTVCISGNLSACPAYTNALPGSSSFTACVATPGFYQLTAGGSAFQCPANYYCPGGFNITQCVANAVSPVQSVSPTACYCDRGYEGVANSQCVACPAGTWCWTGIRNICPDNSNSSQLSSYMANCTCNPGYSGPDAGPCIACLAGEEKPNQGSSSCATCRPNTFAPLPHTSVCAPVTVCPGGQYPSQPYTTTTDNVCATCPANSFCAANARTLCPAPTVSPSNSSTYLACRCPVGTYGAVYNSTAAYCNTCPLGKVCPANQFVCAC